MFVYFQTVIHKDNFKGSPKPLKSSYRKCELIHCSTVEALNVLIIAYKSREKKEKKMSFINYFLMFCVGFVSAVQINKIQSVEGDVKIIEFDSESNVFVVSKSGQTFYKLNSQKEIIVQENFQNIERLIVNPSNNVYVFNYESNLRKRGSIYLLKSNSTVFDKLYEYLLEEAPHVSFQDHKGNLFFNTAFGTAFLNRDQTIPTAIVNLEDFYISNDSSYVVDASDNVYIGGSDNRLATVKSDQTELFAPSAKFYETPAKSSMTGIGLDNDGRIIVGFSGEQSRLYEIENEQSTNLTAVFSQHQHLYSNFNLVNSKLYFFSQNLFDGTCRLNFIYSVYDSYISYLYQYKVEQLTESFKSDMCVNGRVLSDTEGNLFLSAGNLIYLLKNGETQVEEVNLFNKIFSLDVDENGDLWVLGRDLYVIRRNSTQVDPVTRINLAEQHGLLKINKITKEIFFGSESGLYVYRN